MTSQYFNSVENPTEWPPRDMKQILLMQGREFLPKCTAAGKGSYGILSHRKQLARNELFCNEIDGVQAPLLPFPALAETN